MKINPSYFIKMVQKTFGFFRTLLNSFHSMKITLSPNNTWTLFIYLLLLIISVIMALTSCNPYYRVTHRGYGIYTDTIRVNYNSGNTTDFYPAPNF